MSTPITVPVAPLLLTPEHCATLLSCSRRTVYALIRLGDLRAIRLRGTGTGARPAFRVEPAELDAYIARERERTERERAAAARGRVHGVERRPRPVGAPRESDGERPGERASR